MDLFDPARYAGVRRPLLEAQTMPVDCYTSPEFYQREIEQIFMKCWNCIGREDFIKKPGDYYTQSLVGMSLIIMRGNDNKIRAFVNSCRHRGAKLLEGDGHCAAVACPYHGWAYNTDGSLRAFNAMEEAKNLEPKDYGLIEIKLETWMGFIFVNFDPNCISLREYLGDLDQYVESYGFADMVTVGRKDFVIRTNWKSYVENSIEPIHLPLVHQKSIGHVFSDKKNKVDMIDGAPGNFGIFRTITDKSRAVLRGDQGFDKIPTLRGTAAEGAQYMVVNPCTVIGGDLDCMWFKHMVPEGPHMVRNITAFCFPKASLARPDAEAILKNYFKRFYMVINEDSAIAERQFAGINNPLARPGRYSGYEKLVHVFDNWVLDRVVGREAVENRVAAE